jgi:FAD/FMN-containing dehydrogenase
VTVHQYRATCSWAGSTAAGYEGYDRQRPDPFARALRAAKAELDPRALLNPGVLFDPR